jgi:hypothetical protein
MEILKNKKQQNPTNKQKKPLPSNPFYQTLNLFHLHPIIPQKG